jgi:D-alanine-D-alanine ligase-like ATP-grasp enzyme
MNGTLVVFVGKYPLVKNLHNRGLDLINVNYPSYVDKRVTDICGTTIYTDLRQTEEVCNMVASLFGARKFLGAYSQNEFGLLPASSLNERLSFFGNYNSVQVALSTRNKVICRELIGASEASYSTRQQWCECLTHSDIGHFFWQHKDAPDGIIVKPSQGVGSIGVRHIKAESDIQRVETSGDQLIAEIFVHGRQYSVEAFSFDGHHELMCLNEEINGTHNTVNPFIQLGHRLPAAVTDDTFVAIKTSVFRALSKVGIRHGPSHTEVIVNDRGVYILEINARPGSSPIPDLVRAVTGIDVYDLAFDWFLGTAAPLKFELIQGVGAAVCHFRAKPGRIKAIQGVSNALSIKGVKAVAIKCCVGDFVPPLRSAFDRIGYVTATGVSATQAYQRCCEAAACVQFDIEGD